MAYLLDVNVLIARSDPGHEFHVVVKRWLAASHSAKFATLDSYVPAHTVAGGNEALIVIGEQTTES